MARLIAFPSLLLLAACAAFVLPGHAWSTPGADGPLLAPRLVADTTARLQPVGFFPGPRVRVRLGTVGIADRFGSGFALNSDRTWVGLPNATGGPSFFCYSLIPPVSYTFGAWAFDPRIPAVNLYGPDRTPLGTLNGLDPSVPAAQAGVVTGLQCGPALNRWSFLP